MPEIKDDIRQDRLLNSKAGRLITQLLANNLLTEDDLNNPDIVEFVNDSEEWVSRGNLAGLSVGDIIFIIDTENPKRMFKALVVYSGLYQTLAYNDKTLVDVSGIGIRARDSFPQNRIVEIKQKVLPRKLDVIHLEKTQRIFRVIRETTIRNSQTAFELALEL